MSIRSTSIYSKKQLKQFQLRNVDVLEKRVNHLKDTIERRIHSDGRLYFNVQANRGVFRKYVKARAQLRDAIDQLPLSERFKRWAKVLWRNRGKK